MPQYSVRVSEGLGERIEAYADEYDGSKSDALRELLDRGTEYDRIQRENERLHRAQTQLLDQREEHGELVEYVEHERSLQEHREDRERAWDQAAIWTKFKWRVFGRPAETGAKP